MLDVKYPSKKNKISKVAAHHVTDGVVGGLLVDGRDLADKGVREEGAESNKGDLKIVR